MNPLAHLDPIGTLMLVIFRFGWAKPVPINPLYFRDRRRGVLVTSLAGPASNLLGAVVGTYLMLQFSLGLPTVTAILYYFLMYNLWLGLFNLIPVPPLDGSNILRSLAPYGSGLWNAMNLMDQYGWLILMLLLVLGIIPRLLLPVANALQQIIISLVSLVVI